MRYGRAGGRRESLSTRIRLAMLVLSAAACVVGCAQPSPVRSHPRGQVASQVVLHRAAGPGPCATVTTTTPLADVPPQCAAEWARYAVTMVPPAHLTDTTPRAPDVVNETRGAVSDADAQAWALAANASSTWYRWADAHGQVSLLGRLQSLRLYSGVELQALAEGDVVTLPDCDIFPSAYTLFPMDAGAARFFRGLGEDPRGGYVLAADFPGPCVVSARTPAGQARTLAVYPSAGRSLFAGHLRQDPLLGAVWFVDGAGTCDDLGAPAAWCSG